MATTVDRAVANLSALDDAQFVETLVRALSSRTAWDSPARDDLLALIQLSSSARAVMSGVERALLDGVLSAIPRPGDASRMLRVEAEARAAVLTHPMLSAPEVADVLGTSSRNTRDVASALRRNGQVVGIPQANRFLYPAFQFDARARRVRPVVAEVNALLAAIGDPWGVASWWLSPSGRLPQGRSPADEAAAGHDATVRDLAADVTDSD